MTSGAGRKALLHWRRIWTLILSILVAKTRCSMADRSPQTISMVNRASVDCRLSGAGACVLFPHDHGDVRRSHPPPNKASMMTANKTKRNCSRNLISHIHLHVRSFNCIPSPAASHQFLCTTTRTSACLAPHATPPHFLTNINLQDG